jgi:hypothetical protein
MKLKTGKSLPLLFAVAVSFNPKFLKQVGTCTPGSERSPTVYVVKQWHLAPTVNTKTNPPAKPLPQTANQTEIYNQLSEWVKNGTIDTAIAEGCEGEVGPSLKDAFQGWSYSDLQAHVTDKNYPELLAHPVLKLQAKYPKQAKSFCGDNVTEIKKAQLAMSDARADVGYAARLEEYENNPAKLKPYLEGVISVYQLKSTTTEKEAELAVSADLKKSMETFQATLHTRDLSFAQKIETVNSPKPTALVIGGLHTQDLKAVFESKKMNCVIFEPVSYNSDEELLSKKLIGLIGK